MNSARPLIEEHVYILKVIDALKREAKALDQRQNISLGQIDETLTLLSEFADKCHHAKEERVLFVQLGKRDAYKPFVRQFLDEHMKGRAHVRAMRDAERNLARSRDEFIQHANAYARLLTAHIQAENAIFSKVDEILPENVNEWVAREFEQIEEQEIGEERHAEYEKRADKLYAAAKKL